MKHACRRLLKSFGLKDIFTKGNTFSGVLKIYQKPESGFTATEICLGVSSPLQVWSDKWSDQLRFYYEYYLVFE